MENIKTTNRIKYWKDIIETIQSHRENGFLLLNDEVKMIPVYILENAYKVLQNNE